MQPRQTTSSLLLPTIALVAGVAAISSASILVRSSTVGSNATALWRFALALPMLWLGLVLKGQTSACLQEVKRHYRVLTLVGAFLAAHVLFFYWALRFTSVANACALVGGAPIFVALGSFLLFRSRINTLTVVGILAACCGTALLTQPRFQLTPDHLLGNGLAILAAVTGAGYLICAERARRRVAGSTVMLGSAAIVCGALLLPALLSGEPMLPRAVSGWLPLLGLALVSQIVGHGLLIYSLARLPALSSALVLLLEPVLAGGLAFVFLGENVMLGQAMSALLVVGGAVVGQVGQMATLETRRPAPALAPAPAPAPVGAPALRTAASSS